MDSPVPHEVIEHYGIVDEGARLTQHPGRLELLRTQELIRRALPPGPLTLVDVGGGTGIHAAWLAGEDGHTVHLVDPVPGHVAAAAPLAPPSGRITARIGHAGSLPFEDAGLDAALLLGPLYHLTERADRVAALAEASRVVRPGGQVIAAGVCRYASLLDTLSNVVLAEDPQARVMVERDLATGQHRPPPERPTWWTTAYFHLPDELHAEAVDAGLAVDGVLGVEGPGGWFDRVAARWAEPQVQDAALYAARAVERAVPQLSAHLLLFARRPAAPMTARLPAADRAG
jgi:ubiquinone/menaquinone biosynthesis C-methylase UbiE